MHTHTRILPPVQPESGVFVSAFPLSIQVIATHTPALVFDAFSSLGVEVSPQAIFSRNRLTLCTHVLTAYYYVHVRITAFANVHVHNILIT